MPFYPPAPGFYPPRRAPWTPAMLTTLRLWVDDRDHVAVGFLMSAWNDQSGLNHHLTQSDGGKQPFDFPNEQNGRAGVFFQGPLGPQLPWMENTAFNALANATQHTTWIVYRPIDPAGTTGDLLTDSESNGGLWLEQGGNLFYNTPAGGGGYGTFAQASAATLVMTSVFDGTLTGNANRLKVWKNGTQLVAAAYSGTIGAAVGAETGGLKVGRRFGSETLLYYGFIFEIGICAGALNTSTLAKLHTYLNAKWAVW